MVPIRQNDHAGDAAGKLIDTFKNKPIIGGFLKSFMYGIQELEGVFWDIINNRVLGSTGCVGDQLDKLGKLVGEARQGRNDTDYTAAVRLRIRVNRSKGRAEDVIQVAGLALPGVPVTYDEFYPAMFQVTALFISGAASVLRLLGKTRANGTRGVLVYSTWTTAIDFAFDSSTGALAGTRGFCDALNPFTYNSVFVSAQDLNP